MIRGFYERHARHIVWAMVLSYPFLSALSNSLPNNNDVEAWLPRESAVRSEYETFKADFGVEESIVVALPGRPPGDPLVAAVAERIARLEGIRDCWTPSRFAGVMEELGIERDEALDRLEGLVIGRMASEGTEDDLEERSGQPIVGLVALISETGRKDRAGTVDAVRDVLAYSRIDEDDRYLSGGPVVVSELDRLGNRRNGQKFFLITLAISLMLLRVSIGQWRLAFAVLASTVWAINLVLAIVYLAGGEMNFIMGSLSIMVMVFTMAIAIHFVHYYRAAVHEPDPLGTAFGRAWKPCSLATLTTVIGLVSLAVSEMPPVVQFGLAASVGCVVALLVGLFLVPAMIIVCPPLADEHVAEGGRFARVANWLLDRPRSVAVVAGLLVIGVGAGVPFVNSRIDPVDFLPRGSRVAADLHAIERDLTKIDTIEAVVDFGPGERPFVEQLNEVRRLEAIVREHPAVTYTMSAATFFPEKMPEDTFAAASLLGRAQSRGNDGEFVRFGRRLWRISARITESDDFARDRIVADLQQAAEGEPITFTGIAPLLDYAQQAIFTGFWQSFTMAFVIISAVMIVSLRSIRAGLVAMIPNLTPICLVFGTLGWVGFPVDIGMTLTASIALGIAVDGTFHFLVRYESELRETRDSPAAARTALLTTGAPIFEAAVIASLGMLALVLSPFTPTARFGYMMATLLTTALVGDLVLLPALLSLRPGFRGSKGTTDEARGDEANGDPIDADQSPRDVPRPHLLDRGVRTRGTERSRM